jgi:small-conductance mechanosensitive channel
MVGALHVLGSEAPAPVGAQPPGERASTAPAVSPIPIAEIARQAEAVTAHLRRRAEQLAASPEILAVESRLPAAGEDIDRRLAGTSQALASSPSPGALAMLADSWRVTRAGLAAQSDVLTRRARALERELEQTEAMRLTWTASREEALASQAPAPVLERIESTLAALAATRRSVGAQRAWVLGLQDRLVKEIGRCDDALARIARAETALITPPFARDSAPIWSPEARVVIRPDHRGQRLRESVADHLDLTRQFFASQLPRLAFQIAVFVIVLVLARLARARAPGLAETGSSEAAAAQVLTMPVSAALVAALVSTIWIYPQPPRVVLNAVGVAMLLPAVRIVRRLAPRAMRPTVYAVAAFFLIDRLREICSFVPAVERWGFLLQMLLGIVFLALAVHSETLVIAASGREATGWRRALTWLLWGQLIILAIALPAGALGYMRLARLLGGQVLAASYVALVLYAAVPIGEGLVAYALRTPLLLRLLAVARHRDLLQRRIHLTLRWFAVGVWIYLTLDGAGLLWPFWSAAHTVLDARYVRGSISISLGDALAFALTIWAAFLLSSFARFVLREDVYPRVGLARGPAYAVSSLIHYAIVAVSVVLAVAALGLDLTRITILAGAFGLGAGIGLQGAVANFVSGLILLLEGRIRVGDSVQIDNLEGEVRDISSRATTIRTWEGAEVIVPNGRMTSENVTNWTLSDRSHRVDVRVAVTYASDPERVLEILGGVASAHPKVLAVPAPRALCTGFGDSGMTFELRAWISYEEFLGVRSELAIAVLAALTAAGIEIAVPERHVQIRNAEGAARAAARPAPGP